MRHLNFASKTKKYFQCHRENSCRTLSTKTVPLPHPPQKKKLQLSYIKAENALLGNMSLWGGVGANNNNNNKPCFLSKTIHWRFWWGSEWVLDLACALLIRKLIEGYFIQNCRLCISSNCSQNFPAYLVLL